MTGLCVGGWLIDEPGKGQYKDCPLDSNTGGKVTRKWVKTCQEHQKDRNYLPGIFPSGTFHTHLECNLENVLRKMEENARNINTNACTYNVPTGQNVKNMLKLHSECA